MIELSQQKFIRRAELETLPRASAKIFLMKDYREVSSEDQRAWELSKSKLDWKHITCLVALGLGIVIALVLFVYDL